MDVFLDFEDKIIDENKKFILEELKLNFIINLKKEETIKEMLDFEKKDKKFKEENNKDFLIEKTFVVDKKKDRKILKVYEGVYFDKNNYKKNKSYGENFLKALNCESFTIEELRKVLEENSFDIIFNFNYKSDKNYTHNPNNALNEVIKNIIIKKNIFVVFDIKLLDNYNKLSTAIFNSKLLKNKVKILFSTLSKNIFECKNYIDIKSLGLFLFNDKKVQENKKNYEELINFVFYNSYNIKIERKKDNKNKSLKKKKR